MPSITFSFNREKAIEAILYLANRVTQHDIYGICKLLYLTDKVSLEKYGRFIFGESYCAMKAGATPSNAYDLLKEIADVPIEELKRNGNAIIPLRDSNLEYLSESDIECLNQIISVYGHVSNRFRGKAAHDAAYNEAWVKRGNKSSIVIPIESIAGTLQDSDCLIDYLANRNAD